MKAIDRLYKRDKIIKRSINIDQELYSQLQYLSDKVYDSSVNRIINVCAENALLKNSVTAYKRPKNSEVTYRSICLRKEFFDKLMKISEQTGIPFTRIVNGVIKQFLEEYREEFRKTT